MLAYRADHIGSLLRPKALREAFRKYAAGEHGEHELRTTQDAAIRDVIRLQEDCGLPVVTDGEFRRVSYGEKFVRLTAGLEVRDAMFRFHDAQGHESEFTAPYVRGRVARRAPITVDEFRYVKEHTTRAAKITMPAPSTMHFYRFTDWGARSAYADAAAFFGVLVCRGNYKGMYLSEGGYDSVAEKFFGRTNVDHFLLEFDTPRAGGFAPLRFVPKEKGVVLGLVSSKTPTLEKLDDSRRSAKEVQAHGGRVVALGKFHEAMTGGPRREVMILVEWESKAAFESYCNDPQLADLHPHRVNGTKDYLWHLFDKLEDLRPLFK